jgi:hypothetical protein
MPKIKTKRIVAYNWFKKYLSKYGLIWINWLILFKIYRINNIDKYYNSLRVNLVVRIVWGNINYF